MKSFYRLSISGNIHSRKVILVRNNNNNNHNNIDNNVSLLIVMMMMVGISIIIMWCRCIIII